MSSSKPKALVFFLAALLLLTKFAGNAQAQAGLSRGVVATGHPMASEAALAALRLGGNAIDAAIAAGLTLGIVDGANSGIGGGCLILIHLGGDDRIVAIDGRETAPLGARANMFVREGKADPDLSQTGALSIAVPGALAAYYQASALYGFRPFREHLLAAAALAESGFQIDSGYAQQILSVSNEVSRFEGTKAILFNERGEPRGAGEILSQPNLAATYRAIAGRGIGWFYGGPFAAATADWMKKNGGVLSVDDFRRYRVRFRQPVMTSYRGYMIAGFPPPSSGGVAVAETLNIVERFDLKRFGLNSARMIHVVSDGLKLAFADRAQWLGDPDFIRVPPRLITKAYAVQLARRIRLDRELDVPAPKGAVVTNEPGGHTTHFSVADAAGNWVACTATINTTFGSKVIIPGTGVVMNNEMDDFSAQPGATNYFGLIGSNANAIAPGKRPLSSMSPTLVFFHGRPILALGAAGGPTIISQTVLALIDHVDFGQELPQALAQPRFHHQWQPDVLKIEKAAGPNVINELIRLGHRVEPVDPFGATQAVGLTAGGAAFSGAADPRGRGLALGW